MTIAFGAVSTQQKKATDANFDEYLEILGVQVPH